MKITLENDDEKATILYTLRYNGYKLTQNNINIILEALTNLAILINEFDIYKKYGRMRDLEEDDEITNTSLGQQEKELDDAVTTFKFSLD